jgi:predicted RNA-binding Zn ribbon-like protein
MTVDWTEHRFAGGALALDVANTVVLRGDPDRTFDRFVEAAELPRFAEAASRHRATELNGQTLTVFSASDIRAGVIDLRESIDRLFRNSVGESRVRTPDLPNFLAACAQSLRCAQSPPSGVDLQEAIALSALSLLPEIKRIRICQNCRWLFLDRSRNGSRRWCDMAVCGNRQKAKRHYHRHRVAVEDSA